MFSCATYSPYVPRPAWMQQAACLAEVRSGRMTPRQLGDLFFPHAYDVVPRKAKALCDACPVQPDCLEYALGRHEPGVWAGVSEKDRDRIRGRTRA